MGALALTKILPYNNKTARVVYLIHITVRHTFEASARNENLRDKMYNWLSKYSYKFDLKISEKQVVSFSFDDVTVTYTIQPI
jgi:hypothetical protein